MWILGTADHIPAGGPKFLVAECSRVESFNGHQRRVRRRGELVRDLALVLELDHRARPHHDNARLRFETGNFDGDGPGWWRVGSIDAI